MFSDEWDAERMMQIAGLVLLGFAIGCLADRWCIQRISRQREQGRDERCEPSPPQQRALPLAPARGRAEGRRDAGTSTRRRIPSTGATNVAHESPLPQQRSPQAATVQGRAITLAPALGRAEGRRDAGTSTRRRIPSTAATNVALASPLPQQRSPQAATAQGRVITNLDAGASTRRRIDDEIRSSQAHAVAARLSSQRSPEPKPSNLQTPRVTRPREPASPSPSPPPARMRKISSFLSGPDSDSEDIGDHFRRSSRQSPSGCDDVRYIGPVLPHVIPHSRSEGCITDLTPSQARVARWQRQQQHSHNIQTPRPEEATVSPRVQGTEAAWGPPQQSTEELSEIHLEPIQPYETARDNLVRSISEDNIFRILVEEERASNGGATAPGRSARYVYDQCWP